MGDIFHVPQAPGSSVCGQCVVAVILQISLRESVQLFGHKHGTKAKELSSVLRASGVRCAGRRRRWSGDSPLPRRCVLALRKRGKTRMWHWALLWDGIVYDPALSTAHPWEVYNVAVTSPDHYVSSYLTIG